LFLQGLGDPLGVWVVGCADRVDVVVDRLAVPIELARQAHNAGVGFHDHFCVCSSTEIGR